MDSWESTLTIVLFCIVATATYLVAEVYAAFAPARSEVLLARLKVWLDDHTDQAVVVVLLVLGLWLIGKSASVLLS